MPRDSKQVGQLSLATLTRMAETRGFSMNLRKATALTDLSLSLALHFGQLTAESLVVELQLEHVCTVGTSGFISQIINQMA